MNEPVDHLISKAIRGEPLERPPVWAMRQAGRWDPEFRKLREGRDFFEFSENPELAAQASLCPVRFGVDAVILFYDLVTLGIAMGQKFRLVPERGPVPDRPIRSHEDVCRLSANPDAEGYRAVLETLRLVRSELNDSLPALVFAGAPFTLATYQIGAGKDLDAVRRFIDEQPRAWDELLERNALATISFLRTLREAGATAYQLFDSWAGLLTREEYVRCAQPFHERILAEAPRPSILFVKEAPFPDLLVQAGPDVVSLGVRHDLAELRRQYPQMVFQGNVDHLLMVSGSEDAVRSATRACIAAGGRSRHILNLDHGMDRRAKPELFEAFVDSAKQATSG